MKTPQIHQAVPARDDPRKGLLLVSPYSEAMVDQIKDAFPQADRYWWPEKDAWWVAADHMARLRMIVLRHFPSVYVMGLPMSEDVLYSRDGIIAAQTRLL